MITAGFGARDPVPPPEGPRQQLGSRVRLFDIVYRKSFGRGRVMLASGRESDFYFNMKPSMLDPEGAHLIAVELLGEILAAGADYVGGLEMGAVPITGAVCQYSHQQGRPVRGLLIRKQAKTYGAMKLIEGLEPGSSLQGKRVVVIEDVTTTGESALIAVKACAAHGAEVATVLSIVDRQEGASETFRAHGLPFKAVFAASEFLAHDSNR